VGGNKQLTKRYREQEELVAVVLSTLVDVGGGGPMSRYKLQYMAEMLNSKFNDLLNRMWAHELISIDHQGVSITEKGRKALNLYRGLVDMIRC
jgi:predicted transcriptional regulator